MTVLSFGGFDTHGAESVYTFRSGFDKKNGGSAWESNPPGTVLAPHTGFEDREPHQ